MERWALQHLIYVNSRFEELGKRFDLKTARESKQFLIQIAEIFFEQMNSKLYFQSYFTV
jgi:hypothetical protein